LTGEERIALPRKVAIVGAGFVGSTIAYTLMLRGLVSEIVLIDVDAKRAEGEAMDLNHGLPFAQPTRIRVGDYPDCKDAQVMVITAGAAQKLGETRLDLSERNAQVFREVIPRIIEHNKAGVLLVVTNPVDVMTYVALRLSGLPKERVIGSGTILDSARLRYLLGEYLRVDPRNVHAYIIGEHGDSEVPVWSLATVAGIRLRGFYPISGEKHGQEQLDALFDETRRAAYEIIERKGRTYYAIGVGATRILESILRDENSVLTVSSLLEDYLGVSGVCLSVPSIVNRNGIRGLITLPLDAKETEQFHESANLVKEVISSLRL